MANDLTTLRTNIWTALNADTTLTALLRGGSKFDWAGGTRKRVIMQPANMPMLSMGPDAATVPSLTDNTRRGTDGHDHASEWRYKLVFEMATAGQDADACEALTHRVLTVLADEFPFGMRGDGLYAMDFTQCEFDIVQPTDEKGEPKTGADPFWAATLIAEARFRIR